MFAKFALKLGREFPFDASDRWNETMSGVPFPEVEDKARATARGILADLTDRRGIKQGFCDLDEDVRKEIVQSLAAIIREGMR